MADHLLSFARTAPGRFLTRSPGLPQPARLRRRSPERPSLRGKLLHLTAGRSVPDLAPVLDRSGPAGAIGSGGSGTVAVVLDATGVRDTDALAEVHAALHPVVRPVVET